MRTFTPLAVMAAALLVLVGSGARAASRITGTVMDITGPLVVVRESAKAAVNNNTITTVVLPTLVPAPAGLALGDTVAVLGQPQQGLFVASSIRITGGTAWPDAYFGTYPGAEGIPAGTKLPMTPGGPPTVAPFVISKPLQ